MNTDEILPKIIQSMQLNQQVRPTIYAQVGALLQSFPLMHFAGDGRAKAHLLFTEGRSRGLQQPDRELAETCLISEIWLTQGKNPNPGQRPPANIPQIEAVMLAIAANQAPFQTLVKVYEIKRDNKKKPKELKFLNENVDPEGLMGVAFIAGWRSRLLSDEEVRARQPRGMRAFLV
ncbi:MAG TPA: hypothetical protein VGN34_30735 [Ktedonobacteraceae bacterium]